MKTIQLEDSAKVPTLDQIKKHSEDGLVLCFAGVGNAWARKNANTSLIVAKYGKTILVDLGTSVPVSLESRGVSMLDFDYYHFTHSHADHVGAVEELLLKLRYIKKKKAKVIITHEYQQTLWNETLKGGCEINEDGLLRFTDLIDVVRPNWESCQPREKYHIKLDGILDFEIFRTFHVPGDVNSWEKAFWSTGLQLDGKVVFTADTRFDLSIFEHLDFSSVEAIFHDCQLSGPGSVHATYEELSRLLPSYKERMYLTHYGDNFDKFSPEKDEFAGFAKPWVLYKFD
jgi:ribonuclease BN (tRNA processing enzyme)